MIAIIYKSRKTSAISLRIGLLIVDTYVSSCNFYGSKSFIVSAPARNNQLDVHHIKILSIMPANISHQYW